MRKGLIVGTLLCLGTAAFAQGNTRPTEPAPAEPAPTDETTPGTTAPDGEPATPPTAQPRGAGEQPMPDGTRPTEQPRGAGSAEDWAAASNTIAQDLEQAKRMLDKGQRQQAAMQMAQAAALTRLQAQSAPAEERSQLESAASDLDQIAQTVSTTTGKLPADVTRQLALIEQTLASQNLERARRSWESRASRRAGMELAAAARHTENAARWMGTKAERGVRDVTGSALRVSGRLVQGVGVVPEEVGRAIDRLGSEIDRMGKATMPSRPEGAGNGN